VTRIRGPRGTVATLALALGACGSESMGPSTQAPSGPAVQPVSIAASAQDEACSPLRQSVTALPGGGFAAAWDSGALDAGDVGVQLLREDGSPILPANGITLGLASYDEGDAVVAPHPTSGAFVAFRRKYSDFATQIVVASIDGAGQRRWGHDGVVAAAPLAGEVQHNPQLVPDASGGVYVCFQTLIFSALANPVGIRCQHIVAAGFPTWDRYGIVASSRPGVRVVPRAVSDGAGGLLVFWRNQRDANRPQDLMLMEGQRIGADGRVLWGSDGLILRRTNITPSRGHGFGFLDAVPDGRGGAVIGFDDWSAPGAPDFDVFAQRVDANGTTLWGDGVRVAGGPLAQFHEATVAAPDGGAFVAVRESVTSSETRLQLYRLGPDGRHAWPASGTLLSGAPLGYNQNAVGGFESGTLWMTWSRQPGPNTIAYDVRMARFALDGTRRDGAEGAMVSDSTGAAQFVRAAAVQSGRLLVVWDDLRRSRTFSDGDVSGAVVR
jgi:hypothetical protein